MQKVYRVEFIEYTDYSKNTVRTKFNNYINTNGEPFLIFEDEIERYKNCGKGIKELVYVGSMLDYHDRVYGGKK